MHISAVHDSAVKCIASESIAVHSNKGKYSAVSGRNDSAMKCRAGSFSVQTRDGIIDRSEEEDGAGLAGLYSGRCVKMEVSNN